MELLYRLAVEETDFIKGIRNNTITLITPQTEVDGRDRQVDVFNYRLSDSVTIPLVYWGRYTAHDNNRDAIGMSANLTRNMLKGFLTWHPTIVHDLHESVPFMYIMTGTGPYNDVYRAREPYVAYLADVFRTLAGYELAIARRLVAGDVVVVELSETIDTPSGRRRTDEVVVFDVSANALIRRVGVYIRR